MPDELVALKTDVTMPGEPVREFSAIYKALVGTGGLPVGVSPVANPSMAPWGGFTAIPGMHTTAADLAIAINFNWRVVFGSAAPQITAEQAAIYLPGNPYGPAL